MRVPYQLDPNADIVSSAKVHIQQVKNCASSKRSSSSLSWFRQSGRSAARAVRVGSWMPLRRLPVSPLVIVIDDDEAVRQSLLSLLEAEGFAVKQCASGRELLNEPDIADACCLVVDYNLPDMTGAHALRNLRARGIDSPAIIITALLTEAVRRRAAAAGARILEKPFLGIQPIEDIHRLCDAGHARVAMHAGGHPH